MANPTNAGNPKVDLAYRRKKNAAEMKHQVISFALMIALTLVAFFAVGYDEFSHWFSVPFILLLAAVQVAFQLYYFMHMSHKGHEIPALFLYGGVLVAFVTIWAFMTIVWW
ncbi:cytochrome c oxidase subunit IVB [Anoxybacillus rupiensis]|jgi:cytochrome c oxidase subunit IV|uniref:Cytochrome c oxidase subunit IVB n=1 Tax=Anoxybacteroides rupiense TaxID=311460 RepID=A0ABD5IRA4_9BACL|nr:MULTISPECIES: cytochrome c oxidase subunit IVB [Anoxybacillus]KXG10423.1 Cytochrome c oxidase subunit 4B [Anoxybacillus sp. P3H1B]MBB3906293.1 cytochrome c oxidase subunit 4 [Anoxybacillus rupiensis]MBS2770723.1 cytochrome c oxidase subunit IVB [Anoxybacillus rupiensis]MDE8562989.1 cytochrome c oxidase subunit IVB [Anoxybacillus rupiensis]MED5050364.1 cytochrome c oxidase subunit IVB [Anoxybacillus rupiensis]